MKTSTKILIVAITLAITGITLIILGTAVFGSGYLGGINNALFIPGVFLTFNSIPLFISSFSPKIAKIQSKLHSETMDYAGDEIKKASIKAIDIATPAANKTIKVIKDSINDKVYCKHCGEKIDKDSKFCKSCGKEQ